MPQVLNSPYSLLHKTSVQVLLILVVLYATFFQNLQALEPSLMEARNFITVREIMENGTWLIPTLNGEPRLAKPPLPTWLTAISVLVDGDLYNLAALRFPAACISALLVIFLYLFTRMLTNDRIIPFLASLILATSFSFFNIGRQGTWDIYCHSFMMGGLWLLMAGLKKERNSIGLFAGSGFLMGLSFLSKGPVSFYALLLPFLISYAWAYGSKVFRKQGSGILITVIVCLVVSFAWPIYVYFQEPARMATNISNESTAWVNRHVKPFWFYISFPWQVGIWAIFAVAALAIPYAQRRISSFGNYRFLSGWVISCFILLSLIPEKKERYLLPLLMPLALLTAYYLRYLWEAFQNKTTTKPDRILFRINAIVYIILCIGIPVLLYFFAFKNQLIAPAFLIFFSALFLMLAFCFAVIWYQQNFKKFVIAAVVLHVAALYVLMPRFGDMVRPLKKFYGLNQVRQQVKLKSIPFYVVQEMSPEHIWEVGKKVNALAWDQQHVENPETLPAALFSKFALQATHLPNTTVHLKEIGRYQYDRRHPEQVYYLYLLTPNK
ncbi:glycosyltransferase family 39 protein [Adhaeribacter swui]|uniref:Glycosyltransferase family 39 protein n=1 Tax=Adhaeribacter swui TaxID=2086471 RepID=A0A7G7GCU1_9BACT|nr:glycosyltransferase family 39 protein [Adhaeribacter swui]QNF34975.1 glycosyltransferase family 39 protein [Adhaeribacter swui]